ncbi:MAG: hypothetical protein J2P26_04790, partial [Nocardiopsaceae bacterium]|nr:hypothetical protein [Nocardiopsaceae bacterium]
MKIFFPLTNRAAWIRVRRSALRGGTLRTPAGTSLLTLARWTGLATRAARAAGAVAARYALASGAVLGRYALVSGAVLGSGARELGLRAADRTRRARLGARARRGGFALATGVALLAVR